VKRGYLVGVLVVAAVLAGLMADLLQPGRDNAPSHATTGPPSTEPTPRGDQVAAWMATSLARPLFSRTRQAPETGQAVAVAPPPPVPRLTAVLVGPFGRTAMFVATGDAGKPVVVQEGDKVGPYQVRRITPGAVVVDGPTGRLTLHPTYSGAPPAPDQRSAAGQRAALASPPLLIA
jgi:hypothetical protein